MNKLATILLKAAVKFSNDKKGLTALEYTVLGGLIVAVVGAVTVSDFIDFSGL